MRHPIIYAAAAALVAAGCSGAIGEGVERVELPAETDIRVTLDQTLDTRSTQVGDRFSATVTEPVSAPDRPQLVVIPEGSRTLGEVTAIQQDPPIIKVLFDGLEVRGDTYETDLELISAQVTQHSEMKDEAAKIGGGAAAGAVIGGVIGGDVKGAAIGAAAGAAAGTGIALATKADYAHLVAGSKMRLRLEEPLQIPVDTIDEDSNSSGDTDGS